jgi:aryl-alcohol dehydrogenase-like predicted oxidoreductase
MERNAGNMLYRTHQGLSISEIGIGCYALSGAYGSKDPVSFARMLARAVEAGVNFFDTAGAYGEGERVLGQALKPYRDQVLLATKVGLREGMEADLSRAAVKTACERSLRTLGTGWIDLYQVHFDDPRTQVEETVTALEELKTEGKIRHYGVCHLPAERIETYCRVGRPFSILMELSAVARQARLSLLPLARRCGAAAIAFSVTGRGLLTGRIGTGVQFEVGDIRRIDPLFQRERLQFSLRVAAKLADIASRYGKTPAQAAVAWALAQPGIFCALTGPSTREHLEENLGGSGWAITPEDLAELERFYESEGREMLEAQKKSLHEILAGPLDPDPDRASADLVYVLETAILIGAAAEAEVVPLFRNLLGLRKNLGPGILPDLDTLRVQISALVGEKINH